MNPPAISEAPGTDLGLVLDPLVPVPLVGFLALLVGGLTLWVYLRTAARLSPFRRGILILLRLGGVALVLLILLQPSRQERLPTERRDKFTLVAVDASRSMRQTDSGRRSRLDAARELLWESGAVPRGAGEPPPAEIRLFGFGEDAAPLSTPSPRSAPTPPPPASTSPSRRSSGRSPGTKGPTRSSSSPTAMTSNSPTRPRPRCWPGTGRCPSTRWPSAGKATCATSPSA